MSRGDNRMTPIRCRVRSFIWTAAAGLILLIVASGCGALEVGGEETSEPAFSGPISATREVLPPADPTDEEAEAETAESGESTATTSADAERTRRSTRTATPTPSPTVVSEADHPVWNAPTRPLWTPTPAQPPGPAPTPTPVAPLPGLVFTNETGTWWMTAGPVLLSERPGLQLSPNGLYGLYQEDDDIWLVDLAAGEERNLTGGSGRVNCCALWWPARPDTIILGSWPSDSDLGPTTGFLTSVNIDGSDYRLLEEEVQSNALAGPGPDGQSIAYDRAGSSWLYRWDSGPEPLDPVDYGLQNVVRIGGPSWSPDGQMLAWTVAVTDPEWRIAVAIFDLTEETGVLLHPYENAGRGGWFPPPAWSPDGRWLAFTAEDIDGEQRGVWVVAADGSQEAYLGHGRDPVWSPDNRYLIYTGTEESSASGEPVPWLVAPESWYKIPFALPPGTLVIDWVLPGY